MVTTAQPRVTSKKGTDREEKRAPTRNDEASRMICLPNCVYPLFGHRCLLPMLILSYGFSSAQEMKERKIQEWRQKGRFSRRVLVVVAILEAICSMCVHPSMSCHGEECGGNIFSIKAALGLSGWACIERCARPSFFCPLTVRTDDERVDEHR